LVSPTHRYGCATHTSFSFGITFAYISSGLLFGTKFSQFTLSLVHFEVCSYLLLPVLDAIPPVIDSTLQIMMDASALASLLPQVSELDTANSFDSADISSADDNHFTD